MLKPLGRGSPPAIYFKFGVNPRFLLVSDGGLETMYRDKEGGWQCGPVSVKSDHILEHMRDQSYRLQVSLQDVVLLRNNKDVSPIPLGLDWIKALEINGGDAQLVFIAREKKTANSWELDPNAPHVSVLNTDYCMLYICLTDLLVGKKPLQAFVHMDARARESHVVWHLPVDHKEPQGEAELSKFILNGV